MQFIITKNRERILLGPTDWKSRFIQSEFDDLFENQEISFRYNVPPKNEEYVNVGEGFEILPISKIISPEMDLHLEHPVGPFFDYNDDNTVTQTYEKKDKEVHEIQSSIIDIARELRYTNEVSGTTTNINGVDVTIDTSRLALNSLTQAYIAMGDTDVVSWKFKEAFIDLSKSDIKTILETAHNYIQSHFKTEKNMVTDIMDCSTIDDVKNLYFSITTQTYNKD